MPVNPIFNRVYDREYFSGTQAAVYIGDVFVDEITSFSYVVQQTKTPIYGYASQLFDAVAAGPVLVNGNFSINFKESGYMYLILMRYKRLNDALEATLGKINADLFKKSLKSKVPSPFVKDGLGKETDGINRASIERLVQGNLTNSEKYSFYNALAGFSEAVGQDINFENIVEVFEDRVWGTPTMDLDKSIRRTDDNAFDGFDMYVTFGDYTNRHANHTVKRLSKVHLTGSSISINVSGEPIQEEYTFFARNIF